MGIKVSIFLLGVVFFISLDGRAGPSPDPTAEGEAHRKANICVESQVHIYNEFFDLMKVIYPDPTRPKAVCDYTHDQCMPNMQQHIGQIEYNERQMHELNCINYYIRLYDHFNGGKVPEKLSEPFIDGLVQEQFRAFRSGVENPKYPSGTDSPPQESGEPI